MAGKTMIKASTRIFFLANLNVHVFVGKDGA